MKIKQQILEKIDNPKSRTKIAMALGLGEQSIALACRSNQSNGTLTKWAALRVISEETGLAESEILEPVTESETEKVGG